MTEITFIYDTQHIISCSVAREAPYYLFFRISGSYIPF